MGTPVDTCKAVPGCRSYWHRYQSRIRTLFPPVSVCDFLTTPLSFKILNVGGSHVGFLY